MSDLLLMSSEDSDCAALLERALEKNRQEMKTQIILSPDAYSLGEQISVFLASYGTSVYMDHHSFARLDNPNRYSYRFIDTFESKLSLFEFFDGNDSNLKAIKSSSRSAFEDCVFLYHFGLMEKAFAGFRNLERFGRGDRVISIYRDRCEKVLYSKL